MTATIETSTLAIANIINIIMGTNLTGIDSPAFAGRLGTQLEADRGAARARELGLQTTFLAPVADIPCALKAAVTKSPPAWDSLSPGLEKAPPAVAVGTFREDGVTIRDTHLTDFSAEKAGRLVVRQ